MNDTLQGPPTKYLYNGKIYQESDVGAAAAQSNLDLVDYIQKSGIKAIPDSYSYKGKKVSAEDVLDAAQQSKMPFDDYVSKVGLTPFGQKKNLSPSGVSSNLLPQKHPQQVAFNPDEFEAQARAASLEQPKQDNTLAVQPSQAAQAIDSDINKDVYTERKKEINKQAVDNATAQYFKNKGINAPEGSLLYNQQRAKTQALVDNGSAVPSLDKNGVPGLKRETGFFENIKNGWNEATTSAKEADDFVNNMTDQQRVEYIKKHDVKAPDEFIGEKPTTFGSLGHFMGGFAPFAGKAATGALIGAAAVAAAPESMGASLAGLPTAMSFILTAPDMANQGAQAEIIRRYQILTAQHPELSDTERMKMADQGALSGGIGGILTNAALMGTGLKTPISLEAKGVLGKTVQEVAKSGLHMGAVSAGITAGQELESEAEGIHTSLADKAKDVSKSFTDNATNGFLLSGLLHGVPKIMESAIKYSLKDTPPQDIRNVLQANENVGTVPQGTTEKVMSDLSQYNDALNKTVEGLSPESTASIAGLIQKRNKLAEEAKTKDESFKPIYKAKMDAIDQQIADIQRTGKPFEHEIDDVTGKPYQQPTYDDVAQKRVEDLAQRIAKGKPVDKPEDLQTQANFPKELEAELQKHLQEDKKAGKEGTAVQEYINEYLKETPVDTGKPAEPVSSPVSSKITENDIKLAQSEHEKAKAKLSDAEDKLAKEQAKQTDLFGNGTQENLFKTDPEEVKNILDPLKQKVKETKAKLDDLQNKYDNQNDNQPDLFDVSHETKEVAGNKPTESLPKATDKELREADKVYSGGYYGLKPKNALQRLLSAISIYERDDNPKSKERIRELNRIANSYKKQLGIEEKPISEPTNTEENNSAEEEKSLSSKQIRHKLYKDVENTDEPTDIEGKILQYFAGGGKVHPESFSTEVVHKKSKGYGAEKSYASDVYENNLVKANRKDGTPYPTIKQLAEQFANGEVDDNEVRNKIIDILQEHGSREEAARKFLERYNLDYIEAKHNQEEAERWAEQHKAEVEAEENWLKDEANKQEEFEATPEYVQQLIDHYENSRTPQDAETSDTGGKTESNAQAGNGESNDESGSNNSRPRQDKQTATGSEQQSDKGEYVDYKPLGEITGVKNEIVDAERDAKGKEPLRAGGDGTMDKAEQTLAKIKSGEISEEHIRDLTQALANGDTNFKTNLKPDEIQHVLMYDRKTLQDKGADIDKEIIDAKESDNKESLERLLIKKAQNELLLESNDAAAAKTGREWSDVGRARQLIIKNDYSFEALKRKYRAAGDGKVPKDVEDRFRKLSKEIEDKTKLLEEVQKQKDEADKEIAYLKELNKGAKDQKDVQKENNALFEELKKETKARIREQGKRSIEKIKKDRENIKASIKNKWKNHIKGGSAGMNNLIPLDMVPDLVRLAKSYIEEGLAIGKEAVLEHIVDRVHKDVTEAIGDVDKTTVRDAITGYGKIKKPNDNPVEVAFRDIAAQGRLVSSIERANKGENPLKSGAQRDKPSPEQRRLQKELNKAIKDNNIQVKSPEEQIKTSLDAAKTRLRNQIEDYEDAIKNNEKIVKDRKGIEYDEEAKDLKAKRDELRDEYDKIFGTNKELTDEDRIERASKAIQKGIENLEERIKNKDFSQNKRQELSSPELDALKKKRDDLKKVYKDLMDAEGETDRRKLEALKKNIAKRTAYLNEIKRTGNLDKFIADRTKRKTVLDDEARKMKAEQERVKNDIDNMLKQREFDNLNGFLKGLYWGNRFGRGVLIFGLSTLERIAGSVVWRGAFKAPTAAITYGLSKIFPRLAKGAHTEAIQTRGDLATHLATYYSTLFSKRNLEGFKFAFKHHNSQEDLLQGRAFKTIPIPKVKVTNFKTAVQAAFFNTLRGLDINASIHGAEKNLVSFPDFKAYQKTIAANMIREGMTAEELNSDATQSLINQLAYRKSLRTKFMQDNTLNQIQGAIDEMLRRKGNIAYAEMLHGALPITKIASNYISEALTKLPVVGNLAAVKPMFKILSEGFKSDKITEQDKSILLRTLTYQGVGMATYMLGFLMYKNFVPLYGSSANKYAQQKTGDDGDEGWHKAFETFSHSPDALIFNAAVSHAWVWDKYQEEHPDAADMYTFVKNIPDNLGENVRDITSSSPYLQTGNTLVAPIVTGKGLPKATANFISSRLPGYGTAKKIAEGKNPILSDLGIKSDNEEKVKPYEVGIYPKTFLDNFGIGIPGWRDRILKRLLEEKETPHHKTAKEKHEEKVHKREKKEKLREFEDQLNE